MNGRNLRRMFMDLETSPNIVLSWRVGYDIKIDADNIIKERAIICIGYKWEGEDETKCLVWDKNHNDKAMLERFSKEAGEADEIVMHNGDRFDWPWVMARCAFHRINIPPAKTVDTLQWSRRKFNFNSNKLDYIAKFLGIGCKIKTEFGLWKEICLNKCPKSLKLMVDYCKHDVALLEKVHARLAALVPHKTHVGVLDGLDKWTCPIDGSKNVHFNKNKITASGTRFYVMQCKDCGKYYQINGAAFREYQEWRKKEKEKAA